MQHRHRKKEERRTREDPSFERNERARLGDHVRARVYYTVKLWEVHAWPFGRLIYNSDDACSR